MARVLDLKSRKETAEAASSEVMEPSASLSHDFFLAAITVVPAATLWIGFDYLYTGIALGAAVFLTVEYVVPAYRAGTPYFAPLASTIAALRALIRTRIARRV
jgi:hypothetical protein